MGQREVSHRTRASQSDRIDRGEALRQLGDVFHAGHDRFGVGITNAGEGPHPAAGPGGIDTLTGGDHPARHLAARTFLARYAPAPEGGGGCCAAKAGPSSWTLASATTASVPKSRSSPDC